MGSKPSSADFMQALPTRLYMAGWGEAEVKELMCRFGEWCESAYLNGHDFEYINRQRGYIQGIIFARFDISQMSKKGRNP